MAYYLQLGLMSLDNPLEVGIGAPVVFTDEIASSNDESIKWTTGGEITLCAKGSYFINWFVAQQTGLGLDGGNFGIQITSDIPVIHSVASTHLKLNAASGFAVIEVTDSPITFTLVNCSDFGATLSEDTQSKAGIAIFGVSDLQGADGKDGVDGADGAAGADGADGLDGSDGIDGLTPYIGTDGHWFIGEVDTGVVAQGVDGIDGLDGATGADGLDGSDGIDGLTPYIGTDGHWFIGEVDTGVVAQGVDGIDGAKGADGTDGIDGLTPYIGTDGHWFIGEVDTGVVAQGVNGLDGAKGADGADGLDGSDGIDGLTPYIGTDGHWFIGDVDTGVVAQGVDGLDGATGATGADGADGLDGSDGIDGLTPYIGTDGHWFIGDVDTGVVAQGINGLDGAKGATGANGEKGETGATGATGAGGASVIPPSIQACINWGLTPVIVPQNEIIPFDTPLFVITDDVTLQDGEIGVSCPGCYRISWEIPFTTTIQNEINGVVIGLTVDGVVVSKSFSPVATGVLCGTALVTLDGIGEGAENVMTLQNLTPENDDGTASSITLLAGVNVCLNYYGPLEENVKKSSEVQ